MDEKGHGKQGIPSTVWMGLILILVGIIIGASIAPYVEPWTNPARATAMQNAQALTTQNQLLKNQVDCLVNGIELNHGKATLNECT